MRAQDPYQMGAYLAHNTFLADINNERAAKNETYASSLASLRRLVLFRFRDDVTVVPRDSAWFGFYNGSRLLTMEETRLYQVGLAACMPKVWRLLDVFTTIHLNAYLGDILKGCEMHSVVLCWLLSAIQWVNSMGTHMSCCDWLLQEDWIGLRELDESGRLERKEAPGPHMHFTLDW